MKIGIVNSQTTVTQKPQYNVKYRQAPSAIAFCALASGNDQPLILKTIRQLFNVISKEKVVPNPKNALISGREINIFATNLKSKDANVQTLALKKIFKAYASSKSDDVISKFVWDEMVPYVKAENDKKFTNLVLKIHKQIIPQTDVSIIDRIKLIEAIGNKSHIKELESYTGKQPGISNAVKLDDDFRENTVKRAAHGALLNML